MAVYLSGVYYKGFLVSYWLDPNRYRAMVWARNPRSGIYSIRKRRFHDKNEQRLVQRVTTWINTQEEEGDGLNQHK